MRALLLVGGGILIGVGASWTEATRQATIAANLRIDEEVESMQRVAAMTRSASEAPVESEDELAIPMMDVVYDKNGAAFSSLDRPDLSDDAIKVGGEMVQETSFRETALSDVTPTVEYLKHVQPYWDPQATDVVTRVEYIPEEEYEDDNGHAKEQILIHMGADAMPLFVNEGVMVVDWSEILPNTILADMYTKCPPGEDKVLYVRNHANDTDYEVIQEIP